MPVERTSAIDILLVDDRQDNLLTLEAVLADPSYRLTKTRSGKEALRYLLDHEPALILMDVQMPELDGFETASLIKQSERTREIPIIFITAINTDESFALKGYTHGAVDYIYKPFNPQVLKSKVAVFVDLARKTRHLLETERRLRETESLQRKQELAQLELKSLRREQSDQKKYRDLVDGINHGLVWSAAPETMSVLFVSASAEKILGFSSERWLSEPDFFVSRCHPDDRQRVREALKTVALTGSEMGFEHRMLARSDEVVWLHTGVRMGTTEKGFQEIRGLSVDISKIKQAEEITARNKKRSDFLAEASLLLSESMEYEQALPGVAELAVQTIARRFLIEIRNEEGEPTRIESKSPQQSQIPPGSIHEIEVPLTARGKTFGKVSVLPIDDRDTLQDRAVAEAMALRIALAIENSLLYRELQKAVKTRDEFLSIASHELKTPLTPLKIQTQGLMRVLKMGSLADVKPEKINKMLQTSDRQLGRLSKLIDDLLDISRITNGRLTLALEDFDLIELLREIVERFASQLSAAQCTLEVQGPESLWVRLDRTRTEQIVVNLISNALKYGAGKPIELKVEEVDQKLKLTVEDHGIGIAEQDIKRIFERFERAVSESHFGGLGLGLYIVSQIIEAHQGKITVKSELGKGSKFVVELPLRAPSEQSSPKIAVG